MLGRRVPTWSLVDVPFDGERFTKWTLARMAEKVPAAMRDYELVDLARSIILDAGAARDPEAQAEAIHDWVQEHVEWVPDPLNIELVQDPQETIRVGCGDCDDFAVLVAALGGCIGLAACFVAVATTPEGLDHVFSSLWIGDEWLPCDASVIDAGPGDVVPHVEFLPHEVGY